MLKKIKYRNSKTTTRIWTTLFYRIFFWCSQTYYSFFSDFTPHSKSEPVSNSFTRIFYFSNKSENEMKEWENIFSRKIFFSIFIETQKSFIEQLGAMDSFPKIVRKIIKRKTCSSSIEKFFFRIIGTERFLTYTNRFYIKKTKHSNFIDFFAFFLRSNFFPFICACYQGFSLLIWILTSASSKRLKKLTTKIVIWQKRVDHDFSLRLRNFFKKGLHLFLNKLDHFSEVFLKFKKKNEIMRYLEFIFFYESIISDYFFSRTLGKLGRFLTQRITVMKIVLCRNFIFVFFHKNLESYEDKFFLLHLKCLFTEKNNNRLLTVLNFISYELKIVERIDYSIVIFSLFRQNYFSLQTKKSAGTFFSQSLYHKKKSVDCPIKLDFLKILRCYDSIPKKIQILLFSISENIFFLKEKKFFNNNIESLSFQDYSFRIKKISYYVFVYFFLFEIGSIGTAEKLKKTKLEKRISKYFLALKDYVFEKPLFQIDHDFIFSKVNTVQELFIALFKKKIFSELQIFYFQTRLVTISNIYFSNKPLFRFIEAQINSELATGKKFPIKNQLDISKAINFKFLLNLRKWIFFLKCTRKKKTLKNEYFKDTVTSKIIFTRVNLMENNNLNKTEKGLKFLPFSIFRCSRLFSRFFFLEMMKEKQLFWGHSQTRILIESSGFFCNIDIFFFIQVNLFELIILIALSRLQIILKKDMEFFFSPNRNQLSQTVDKLRNLGLIQSELDTDFSEIFLLLNKTFFPKAKITKIPTFFCPGFLGEDRPFRIIENNDHIYVSEATMVKFLKLKNKIKCEELFVNVRKKLQKVFFSDPRGIILQGRILTEKNYIGFLSKEDSYHYIFD